MTDTPNKKKTKKKRKRESQVRQEKQKRSDIWMSATTILNIKENKYMKSKRETEKNTYIHTFPHLFTCHFRLSTKKNIEVC